MVLLSPLWQAVPYRAPLPIIPSETAIFKNWDPQDWNEMKGNYDLHRELILFATFLWRYQSKNIGEAISLKCPCYFLLHLGNTP